MQLSAYNRKMSKILLEYPQDKSTEKRRLIKCLNNEFRAKFEETVGWENRQVVVDSTLLTDSSSNQRA